MVVAEELGDFRAEKDTILTIGVFDGVHLGHKHLVSNLVRKARERGFLAGVITFRQHPVELLSPSTTVPLLTDLEERTRLLKKEGVDFVIPLSFTPELRDCRAQDFIAFLKQKLRMRGLVVGPDFALGCGREGTVDYLIKLGPEMGFEVSVVSPFKIDSEIPSSTAIRLALARGDLDTVRRLAGRDFSLRGRVVKGAGRGTSLGFPTANLDIGPGQALPSDGVYASWAHVNGNAYQSMTNVGTCPTFDGCPRTVEVYIMDYSRNIYGKELLVDIVKRVRDEKKFSSAEALKKQMRDDVRRGVAILKEAGHDDH